ncbi:MAG: hypothetical protein RSA24_04515, partial [Clostridia bacterium]
MNLKVVDLLNSFIYPAKSTILKAETMTKIKKIKNTPRTTTVIMLPIIGVNRREDSIPVTASGMDS